MACRNKLKCESWRVFVPFLTKTDMDELMRWMSKMKTNAKACMTKFMELLSGSARRQKRIIARCVDTMR